MPWSVAVVVMVSLGLWVLDRTLKNGVSLDVEVADAPDTDGYTDGYLAALAKYSIREGK